MSTIQKIEVCDRCLTPVSFEQVSEGYYAFCPNHDEDLYPSEVKLITEEEKPSFIDNLSELCQIEASGTFLTEHLNEDLLNGDDNELNEFINDHKWQPVENYEPGDVIGMITDLGSSIERFIDTTVLSKLPNYAVIWHYEGHSPSLFTCRAESQDEAEALLHAAIIDNSEKTELYIDSIEQLKL